MNVKGCWELFLRTGSPVFYLLYCELTAADDAAETA